MTSMCGHPPPPPLRPAWVGTGGTRPWCYGARPTQTPSVPRTPSGYGSAGGDPLLTLTRACRGQSRGARARAADGADRARHVRGRRAGARIQRRRRGVCRGWDRSGPAYAGQRRSDYDRALISVTPTSLPPDHQRIQVRVGGQRQRRAVAAADGDAPRCLVRPRRLTVSQTGRMGRRLGDTRVDRHQRPGPQIRVGHLNVNRLMPSIDDVNLILQDRNLDILCLSETFLSDKVDDRYLIFPGYVVKRRDRQTNGGGV